MQEMREKGAKVYVHIVSEVLVRHVHNFLPEF